MSQHRVSEHNSNDSEANTDSASMPQPDITRTVEAEIDRILDKGVVINFSENGIPSLRGGTLETKNKQHLKADLLALLQSELEDNMIAYQKSLLADYEEDIAEAYKRGQIDENQRYLDQAVKFRDTPRNPDLMYTDQLGSAGAGMEQSGYIQAFEDRIAELSSAPPKADRGAEVPDHRYDMEL